MSEIHVLHLGAVLERARGLGRQLPGLAGHRGEDALNIGAHTVIVAEPDAPDDFRVRQGITQLGHLLIGDTGSIHVEEGEVRHAGGDELEELALVFDADILEIHFLIAEVEGLAVDGKLIVYGGLRAGGVELVHLSPGDGAFLPAAESDRSELRKPFELHGSLVNERILQTAQIDALSVERIGHAHDDAGLRRRFGCGSGSRRGRSFGDSGLLLRSAAGSEQAENQRRCKNECDPLFHFP